MQEVKKRNTNDVFIGWQFAAFKLYWILATDLLIKLETEISLAKVNAP